MTAIVTDAHYRMAVALLRDLRDAGVTVIACEMDTNPAPVGFAVRGLARCVTLPKSGYDDALFALCEAVFRENGEKPALLPVGAATLAMLASQHARFDAVCGLCIPSAEQLALFNDKNALAALGARLGLAVPACFVPNPGETDALFAARVALPCVVKPACGEKFGLHAESRYRIVHTAAELESALAHFRQITGETPIVQEYLPGGGFGCSVLASGGEVVYAICHERVREYPVSGGPSSCCKCIDAPRLVAAAKALVHETGYSGLAMFEFKADTIGEPRLLECNPRVWGTYPLTRAAKTTFALCWCCLALERPLPPRPAPRPVKMAFYPSDFAAGLGYLRRGQPKKLFDVIGDYLDPNVKNGLHEKDDPDPGRVYRRSLLERKRSK